MFIPDSGSDHGSRIRIKEFKYFNPIKLFLSFLKYDQGLFIPDPDPDFYPSRIPDPVPEFKDPVLGVKMIVFVKISPKPEVPRDASLSLFWMRSDLGSFSNTRTA
jgi:hypothetical protein